jgi:hypothetical protein
MRYLKRFESQNEAPDTGSKFRLNGETDEFFEIRRRENNKLHSVLDKCGIDYWSVFSVNLVDVDGNYIINGDVNDISQVWMSVGNSATIMNEAEFKAFVELAQLGYEISVRVNRVGAIAVNISREVIV